jgi:hypothetical protein
MNKNILWLNIPVKIPTKVFHPFNDEILLAWFEDPVRTAQ